MPLTRREVEKIAELAHLEFTPAELEHFARQFQAILDYVAELQAVPVQEIGPTYHALEEKQLRTPLRRDQVRPSLAASTALANAPDAAEDHFRVPTVME